MQGISCGIEGLTSPARAHRLDAGANGSASS
jgi:hypothetical protein